MIICLIPIVGKLMGVVQVRYLIACGFFIMGLALFYSAQLVPTTSYAELVRYRVFQTSALAFLFVPLSTIAYSTLPKELNSDASAMFSMSRNYIGSLAISLATAAVTETKQVRQSLMAHWSSDYNANGQDYLNTVQKVAVDAGLPSPAAHQFAVHSYYQSFMQQVSMVAYNQTFMVIGIMAFCVVPFCFLLSPMAKKGPAGGAH